MRPRRCAAAKRAADLTSSVESRVGRRSDECHETAQIQAGVKGFGPLAGEMFYVEHLPNTGSGEQRRFRGLGVPPERSWP